MNRKFADSSLEGTGFELPVPRENCCCYGLSIPLKLFGFRRRGLPTSGNEISNPLPSSGESCKPSVAAAEKQHVTFADDRGDLFSDPNIVCGHPPAPALIAAWRRNVALLGAAITATRTLRAQQKPVPVIGYLDTGSLNAFPSYLAAFREGLSLTGYET